MTRVHTAFAIPFADVSLEMLARVGGKNASLGEMTRALRPLGVRVPDGFALTTDAFRAHLEAAGLTEEISRTLKRLDVRDVAALAAAASRIRERVAAAPLPPEVRAELAEAYAGLSRLYGEEATDVAVRSSATAEDLPAASFAGQQESYLNVRGIEALDRATRACMASLYTDRSIVYRVENRIPHDQVLLSVGVQKMVRSDLACAGVIFTCDTESGFRDVVLVTGSWGLGEYVVKGRVNPDEFWVHKPTLLQGFRPIVRRELGSKAIRLVYGDDGERAVRERGVPREDRRRFVLSDDEVLQLARWAVLVERHYATKYGREVAMDLEWARDGRTGELFVLQARPETVHSAKNLAALEIFRIKGSAAPLVTGRAVGQRVASGPVRVVHGKGELSEFKAGEVLVAEMTDPDWEPVLRKAAAVVTDQGGRTCHAAIVSREMGLPCVVGCGNATTLLREGQVVTVSCAEGEQGRVYEGAIPWEKKELRTQDVPETRVPLMINIADPDLAFRLAGLPCAGVGLLRIEFLITGWIGVHPMALLHPERVSDILVRAEVLKRASAAPDPPSFFVERMASGVAVIAAAFYPRPVIVRFSDFKTGEYAGLLGGSDFEPEEENPMIGFRGASRYYDDRYREAFALECRAIRRVRNDMGLTNVKVMVPFCRTLEEGRRVIAEMEKNGLRRGEGGLEAWVMCEIPNNVILAKEFSALFDGFSIGSNDLTQLTLGVDRDSELLAHIFDERDPGVMEMIRMVVKRAHEAGRRVGICGQAPSDYPDFAEFLAKIGIDSISLNPDSIPSVAPRLARR